MRFHAWPLGGVAGAYDGIVRLSIELDREEDGRWIAEVVELPGVLAYGPTREQAIAAVERLAVEVVADRIAHRELPESCFNLAFSIEDEQLARI
jgi:predicted RNase H-like HicB family nuclease